MDSDSDIFNVEVSRSKDKQVLLKTFMDALLTMFPAANFVKQDVKTHLGFIIGKFYYRNSCIHIRKQICILCL